MVDKVHSNNLQAIQSTFGYRPANLSFNCQRIFIKCVFSCVFWFILQFIKVTLSQHSTKCHEGRFTISLNKTEKYKDLNNAPQRTRMKPAIFLFGKKNIFVDNRATRVVLRPTVRYNLNRRPRSLSSLCSDEWSAWVWAAWCRRHKPC